MFAQFGLFPINLFGAKLLDNVAVQEVALSLACRFQEAGE
jgi:hypothetical protein